MKLVKYLECWKKVIGEKGGNQGQGQTHGQAQPRQAKDIFIDMYSLL